MKIICPPKTVQAAIVAHIDRETAKIDTLIGKYERELVLLEEYRVSLISHAVTGKIDVRSVKDEEGRVKYEEGRGMPMAAEEPGGYVRAATFGLTKPS